jgi:NADH dehydrogenase
VARQLGRRRWILGLGEGAAELQAKVFERLPGRIVTRDNLRSLEVDSVCSEDGLEALGIRPTSLEAVAPAMLARAGRESYYQSLRVVAGRG